ncbi:glycerophosphoryl diester phosphodiesterase [Austwickia chelonae]|uniref:Putative glycerophosphoryl diester phosphodiesterase n=1 Tax=Austwickia chelonae NBRC 105200 TaxID=1184607 RepID=K6W6A5_9MICO|nr:glycerophosphodiester phosphodiesterase [Austwickia chelonae]GAB77362.1 putative glycerophosphoryl diester phosphodiesterase [Austwickia chelonae NBRC 105200]SEW08703.1 glycerophosphoryl diester phosphodiesterase [Austwickia chelonae]
MTRGGYLTTGPLALAHRGGTRYAPTRGKENTLKAFAAAVDLGYRYLETDVHLTSDGVLLALHDDRLERVSDISGAVAEMTFEEVRRARIGGSEPIPTLRELFTAFPDAHFNIDLKAEGTGPALWALLEEIQAHDRVCVSSFSRSRLWAFRRLSRGRVATAAGRWGITWLRFAPAPLARWIHSPAVAYQIPLHRKIMGRSVTVLTPQFLATAQRTGAQVHVWTIDDIDQMRELFDMGVDGLFTDRIDVLAQVLQERGAWPQHRGRTSGDTDREDQDTR